MSDDLKRFICLGCGFMYDEALGLPEHDIAPGTRWADIPENWACPDCLTPKHRFEMVEIPYAPGGPRLPRVGPIAPRPDPSLHII
jgi:rubredoxin